MLVAEQHKGLLLGWGKKIKVWALKTGKELQCFFKASTKGIFFCINRVTYVRGSKS